MAERHCHLSVQYRYEHYDPAMTPPAEPYQLSQPLADMKEWLFPGLGQLLPELCLVARTGAMRMQNVWPCSSNASGRSAASA